MHATVITTQVVQHTAQLANIPLREDEVTQFADGFTTTMVVVDQLRMVDTAQVEPTFQVTGLTNIWREDEVYY
jgi:aspartyl-tRNA(Asn)/glutamyl-tRNA(Gln) amidotransferase subunit C